MDFDDLETTSLVAADVPDSVPVTIQNLLDAKKKLEENFGVSIQEYQKTQPRTLEVFNITAFKSILSSAGVSSASQEKNNERLMYIGSMRGITVVENKSLKTFAWQFKNADGVIIESGYF